MGDTRKRAVQPVFVSRKIAQDLKRCKNKPKIVNQQRVVYHYGEKRMIKISSHAILSEQKEESLAWELILQLYLQEKYWFFMRTYVVNCAAFVKIDRQLLC